MKILEQGDVKEWNVHVRCTGEGNNQEGRSCSSLLEVTHTDLIYTQHGMNSLPRVVTFRCMNCGTLTNIPFLDIPDGIRIPDMRSLRGYPRMPWEN